MPRFPTPPEREPTRTHNDGASPVDLRDRPIAQRLKDLSGLQQEISAAYVLWLASAAFSVVLHVASLVGSVGTYGRGALVLDVPSLIFATLISVAIVYLAVRMKESAPWARIALSIVGAITTISSIITIGTIGMGIITALMQIVATTLMWTAAGHRWFRTSTPDLPAGVSHGG
ncbi:hypothetical protein GCM10009611_18470 [Arthrobacter roseus]